MNQVLFITVRETASEAEHLRGETIYLHTSKDPLIYTGIGIFLAGQKNHIYRKYFKDPLIYTGIGIYLEGQKINI